VRKFFLLIFGFLISTNLFSQQAEAEIDIVHFNSTSSYSIGSGISIHMNPKGIYKLGSSSGLGSDNSENNKFTLELSDNTGSFNSPITLSSIYDFYSPLINGVIPENISSGNYKLRVKASLGLQSETGNIDFETSTDYGVVYSEELDIQVSNSNITSDLTLTNLEETGQNVFNCLDDIENPSLGSLIVSANSDSGSLSDPDIYIQGYDSENITINLYNTFSQASQSITYQTLPSAILFSIPDDLDIGTYTIEVEETLDSGDINVISFSFLWHRNATSLTNLDNEEICVGSDVGFSVATDNVDGVGENYFASYYSLDFGDGTTPEIFTHAYLLVSNVFNHTFSGASCILDDGSEFEVTKLLFNDKDCKGYDQNGQGKTTEVSASVPPVANFDFSDQYCINPQTTENLIIINQTDLGQYGAGEGTDCLNLADYTWYVQRPGDPQYYQINNISFPNWTTNVDTNNDGLPDLVVPDSELSDQPGCWDFRLNAENDQGATCNSGVFAEGTVNVLEQPEVNFNIQDLSGNSVEDICPGETVTLLNLTDALELECQLLSFEWDINPTNPPEIDDHCSFTGNTNPFSESPLVTFNEPGEYEITLTVTNGICEPQEFSYPFTVLGTPSVTLNTNGGSEQVCLDTIDENNPYTIDFSQVYSPQYTAEPFAPSSYSWEISGEGITTNDYEFVNGTSNTSDYPVIEFYSFECYDISVSVDSACETSASDTFTLSVDQNPIANFEILATTGEVVGEICPGETVQLNDLSQISGEGCQDVTYEWGISALVPGTPAQHCAPATGSSWTDPSPYIIFSEPGVYEISVQVTAGSCPVDTYTDTIIVEGPPEVNIDVNGESSDQICLDGVSNSEPHQIDFSSQYTPTYSNDTGEDGQSYNSPSEYLWEITGNGITSDDYEFVSGSSNSDPYPIINFYSFGDYVITTTVNGDCGISDSNSFAYSINEIPSITNPDSDFQQILCSSDSTDIIEFQSSMANTTFTWSYSSADTYLSGYNSQTSNTGDFDIQQIFNSSDISGEVLFEVTPSTDDCDGETKIITITVNPTPSIEDIDQEICTGSGISITPTVGTIPAGTTYSWDAPTSSPSGAITGGTSGTDETTIADSELLNSTNSPAVLTYTVTPITTDDCTSDPFTVSVTVNPLGQVDNPGDQEFCNNDNISINFTTDNTGGDTTYSWTNTNSAIGLSNSGTGNLNVTATNTTNDPITSSVTVTPSFEGCDGTPQTFTITVNPAPQLDDPSDQIIFTGESTTAVTLTSSVNGVTYSWSANEPTGNLIGLSQSSGTSNQIPSETLVNDTSGPLVLTYTITPILEGVDCDAVTEEYTITINPPVTMLSIEDQVVCNGDDVNVDFESANSGGSTTFEWTNDTPEIGLAASGSGDIPTFTAINSGSSPIVATVTVTPTFENGGISSEGDPQTFTITVNPIPETDIIEDQILCNGDDSDAINFETSNTSGTTTYSWVNDTPSIGLASSGSGDIASFAAVNNNTSPVTATITVTPTYTNEGVSCDGPEETFTITVNPTAQVDDPQDQIICNGETTSVEFTTQNTGGTTTYAWANDTPSIGLGDIGTGNIASFAGVNEGTSPVVATITVTPTFTENGVSCTGPAETFTITVNPTGQIEEINSQVLCNADETAAIVFSTENSGGATVYSWENDTPSIGLTSSGVGDISSFNVVNNGDQPVIATVVVTPSFEGCDGPTETFTITVNPTAEMNDPEDMVVCNAEVTDIVEFTTDNTGGTTTYTWTNDTPGIGLAASGSGDLPSFTAINTGTEPIVATVEVTPLFTDDINCDGISQTFTITVNPSAQVNDPNDQVLCNGDSILVEFTTQNTIGNTTYTWTSDIDFGNGLAGTGNIDFNVVNNDTFPSTAIVTVIPIMENLGVSCSGPVQTFTVTVNGNVDDQADISNYNGFEISCFESNDGYINLNPSGGSPFQTGAEYTYSWEGPNGFTSSLQNISDLSPGMYNVTITDSLSCSFEFEYEIIEPDPLEIIVDEQSDVQCNGVFDGVISISPQGGAAPYTYEWTKDGVFFSNEQNIDSLEPGTYVVFLNDANLCGPVSQIFEIVQPDPIEISLENSVDILCFGENTGSIDISVIGGIPEQISTEVVQYNYLWIGPNGYTSSDQDIDNLFAGIYSVTVSDSLGCEEIFEVELTQPDELIINYSTTDNSCYESNDGTITLDIQGGVEPYQIFWSNFGNGPIQTNLSAGIYEVTVIDSHDCEEVVNIEILEAPIFDTNPVQTNISCFGDADGSINLNITGGVTPVFVTWDDDPTAGEERNNLGPGTYNVLIEDSSGNNCTISHEFIIVEPQELVLNAVVTNPLDCDNVNSGSIDLQVIGGTKPYTFLWSNGSVTEDLDDVPAGNYSVSVIDFMGCEVLDQFELTRPSDIESNLIIDYTADCENAMPSQITTLEVSGGVPPYSITWSDGVVTGEEGEIMTTSQNGTYVVDIIDSLGCTNQILFDVDLFELGDPGFTYDSNGLMLCDSIGVNDLVQFTNTSTGDYTNLIWNFGDGTPLVEGVENPEHTFLYEGTYEITLTAEYPYGCTYTYSETIVVTEGYGLVLPNTFTPNGDGINDTIRPWYKCMSSIEVSIYDTFGSLLYVESSTDEIYGWDGLINGRPAENGNYIIVVRAVSLYGQEIELNGPVTLVR